MTQGYTTRKDCRACGGQLIDVFDLGVQVINNFSGLKDSAPLCLTVCDKCGLHQLRHTVDPDRLYRKTYGYRSSLNPTMTRELQEIAHEIEINIELRPDDIVLDIGCNDGTLLNSYITKNLLRVGFDPAPVDPDIDVFRNTYFDALLMPAGKVRVVTSIAMFYDLEDIHDFVRDVESVLARDGIWVIQLMDLYQMYKSNGFDNICHEHLEYYTLKNIVDIMNKHGLTVFRVQESHINGGSLRIFIGRNREVQDSVSKYLKAEQEIDMDKFVSRVDTEVFNLVGLLELARSHGKTIAAIGASTKANTLLQYAGIGSHIIECVGEINPDKFGGIMTTGIPIVPEEEALNHDIVIILIWQFADYIKVKYPDIKFITPLPVCRTL